jgi:hypothetical protein
VIRLQRVEAFGSKRRYPLISTDKPRMRERGHAARLVDAIKHVSRRHALPRYKRGLSTRQPPGEGFVGRRDVTSVDERSRNPWPSRRLRSIAHRGTNDPLGVERQAKPPEARNNLTHAIDSPPALLGKERVKPSIFDIDEIPEHVKISAGDDPGNLDSGHERYAGPRAGVGRFCAPTDRVVVGDAEH